LRVERLSKTKFKNDEENTMSIIAIILTFLMAATMFMSALFVPYGFFMCVLTSMIIVAIYDSRKV
jgi:hypothetical protein